ncbi:glutaminase A [Brevibacillus dissolubilis]|uniref:glutaminase A n=1 Tax=Brevibacillus dissolubilis TaxID=1844116 RepID=UPI0011164B9D|nr:glutaminase A [Brevibacillus dissolubilis]
MIFPEKTPHEIKADLEEALLRAQPYTQQGHLADYIPVLGKSDPSMLGISVTFLDGTTVSAGDTQVPFTMQSVSKIFSLIVALQDRSFDYVFSRVGMEPTGDPFNSIVKLETIKPHRPLNPMINAGAIAVSSLVSGSTADERFERILDLLRRMSGRPDIQLNQAVYQSELDTADRNRALAYFMRDSGIIEGDVEEILDLYVRHCAIELCSADLSRIAAILSNDGFDLFTGEQIVPLPIARIVKTFMVTCGMYNASGEYAISVGVPSKSGVSGGIMATVPHKMGIGVFGPSLDEKGNSIGGVKLLEELSARWNLSIF